jgi:hypothetical protein
MQKIKYCSITVDEFTSNTNISYMGVTMHYINSDFENCDRVLALRHLEENKDSAYLYDKFTGILNEWNILNKVIN